MHCILLASWRGDLNDEIMHRGAYSDGDGDRYTSVDDYGGVMGVTR